MTARIPITWSASALYAEVHDIERELAVLPMGLDVRKRITARFRRLKKLLTEIERHAETQVERDG